MHKERLVENRTDIQRLSFPDIVPDIAADMQNADDIVDRPLIDREPAVILLLDKLQDLLLGHIDIDRRDIYTARQDALDRDISELQRGRDQVALLLVDRALLSHILDNVIDIVFRHSCLIFAFCHLRGAVADKGEQRGGRPEHCHQKAKRTHCGKTQRLGIFSRNTFRQHFSEEKHYQSCHKCRN